VNEQTASQRWHGKLIGVIAGLALLRAEPLLGALLGLLIGQAFDARWFATRVADPYRVLGLTEAASDAEITAARRRLIARHHPDRADGHDRHRHERRLCEINAAYDRIRILRATPRT
jgi:DnaJ-domain-containing protein 1